VSMKRWDQGEGAVPQCLVPEGLQRREEPATLFTSGLTPGTGQGLPAQQSGRQTLTVKTLLPRVCDFNMRM
jgi:hypothetical protein